MWANGDIQSEANNTVKIINKENCFDDQGFYGNVGAGVPRLKGRQVPGKKLRTPRGVSTAEVWNFCALFSISNI